MPLTPPPSRMRSIFFLGDSELPERGCLAGSRPREAAVGVSRGVRSLRVFGNLVLVMALSCVAVMTCRAVPEPGLGRLVHVGLASCRPPPRRRGADVPVRRLPA